VTWFGTQHNPNVERTKEGAPVKPAGTLWVIGNLKEMDPYWLVGVSLQGYGTSLAVGLGVPIPLLNEDIAAQAGLSDKKLFTQIVDYGHDYPKGIAKTYGRVSYAELKSGSITIDGKTVPTVPLSSTVRARMIADILKQWIIEGRFLLGEPQFTLPT
jgi:uncharacterized protein (DUF39 family)